ncbi:CBS domain-containing protein [Halarchaeum rubridurum]|uniref:CBS domain-containing protein n=1 Tax=Halarchaeum rubridurum TaxID=489911 RepID=A0A830FZ89_9EURY|nr:CBS domain-containing protein [Halarchaeum rubridurum]MBP1953398.1 CBS domain-containing protein [Halarchaeum rubridurum]GGM65596.1 inosine-5-monophosphate dehydrogenase [Halarchaeum rubridurum]
MEDVFIARVMTAGATTVTPETSVEEAAQVMLDQGIGSVVVVDEEGRLAGILTTTDFVRIVAERQPKDESTVADFMTTDVVTAVAQDVVTDVAKKLLEHQIHHIPVVTDDDHIIGIATTTDLTSYVTTLEEYE